MAEISFVRVNWNGTAPPFHMPGTRWFDLCIGPEPAHPFGRKGLALAGAWRQLGGRHSDGMLIMDGDVAIDPLDLAAMLEAIDADPAVIYVAPVRLWPASTQRPSWVWGHWLAGEGPSQDDPPEPTRWTFGFTYLPRALLEHAIAEGLRRWTFPGVDMRMAETAQRWKIPVRRLDGCYPKHMHY